MSRKLLESSLGLTQEGLESGESQGILRSLNGEGIFGTTNPDAIVSEIHLRTQLIGFYLLENLSFISY